MCRSCGSDRMTFTGLSTAGDPEGSGVQLKDLVTVHAGHVDPGPCMVRLHAMGHVAGRNVGDLVHCWGMHHRHDIHSWMIAMEIGVGDERELPVRRDRDRGWEHLHLRSAD